MQYVSLPIAASDEIFTLIYIIIPCYIISPIPDNIKAPKFLKLSLSIYTILPAYIVLKDQYSVSNAPLTIIYVSLILLFLRISFLPISMLSNIISNSLFLSSHPISSEESSTNILTEFSEKTAVTLLMSVDLGAHVHSTFSTLISFSDISHVTTLDLAVKISKNFGNLLIYGAELSAPALVIFLTYNFINGAINRTLPTIPIPSIVSPILLMTTLYLIHPNSIITLTDWTSLSGNLPYER